MMEKSAKRRVRQIGWREGWRGTGVDHGPRLILSHFVLKAMDSSWLADTLVYAVIIKKPFVEIRENMGKQILVFSKVTNLGRNRHASEQTFPNFPKVPSALAPPRINIKLTERKERESQDLGSRATACISAHLSFEGAFLSLPPAVAL